MDTFSERAPEIYLPRPASRQSALLDLSINEVPEREVVLVLQFSISMPSSYLFLLFWKLILIICLCAQNGLGFRVRQFLLGEAYEPRFEIGCIFFCHSYS